MHVLMRPRSRVLSSRGGHRLAEAVFRLPIVTRQGLGTPIPNDARCQREVPRVVWHIAWVQPLQRGAGRVEELVIMLKAVAGNLAIHLQQCISARRRELSVAAPP